MALASVEGLTFEYPGADAPALHDVSLDLHEGEVVALLGPSGAGKSTLLRALSGLVPHFHGGRFAGRVEVFGADTRTTDPAQLAGAVATVFQDPEDQVVMSVVRNEVAFGLENTGVAPAEIWPRTSAALAELGIGALAPRRTSELSGGELQRVCLASALAVRPRLLLLDEPTSQLDPAAAVSFLARARELGVTVVLSEHRIERVLELSDRIVFVEGGTVRVDAARDEAVEWLSRHRPAYVETRASPAVAVPSDPVVTIDNAWFAYDDSTVALLGDTLEVRRGEVVALEGPNGSGKSTLAKLAAGLLAPQAGTVTRSGRAAYLSQDPGRYLVCERAVDEVALGVAGDRARAERALADVGLRWAAERHPRDLSSGERQRLALAAVCVSEPDLLVLDEPTRGLDPERKARLAAWLANYAAAGRGVLVVTHDHGIAAHRRLSLARKETLAAA